MKIYVYNNKLLSANILDSLPESVSKQFVVQEVPNDAKIEDFVNEIFSENAYNNRIRLEQEKQYKSRVQELIRQKYSLEDELEISRKRDINLDEFQAYYDYVESCIAQARSEFGR